MFGEEIKIQLSVREVKHTIQKEIGFTAWSYEGKSLNGYWSMLFKTPNDLTKNLDVGDYEVTFRKITEERKLEE